MEIYRNSAASSRTVTLPFPVPPVAVDVTAVKDGVVVHEFSTVTVDESGVTVTVPLFLTHNDSKFDLRWELSYIEDGVTYNSVETTPVSIVTPILTTSEIKTIDEDFFADPAEVVKIEKAVRHIIQAYTGQEFGHFYGTEKIKGSNTTALFSPRRIIELTSVDGIEAGSEYALDADGHVVYRSPWGVPPIKADYHGLHYHTGGVIHNPNHVSLSNWNAKVYELTGRFGWEYVPAQVKEAAKLLTNDYACADSQYRDRYLTSMTAADWRIQFNSGAFLRTGNVRADQLLSDFVVTRGWGVI